MNLIELPSNPYFMSMPEIYGPYSQVFHNSSNGLYYCVLKNNKDYNDYLFQCKPTGPNIFELLALLNNMGQNSSSKEDIIKFLSGK